MAFLDQCLGCEEGTECYCTGNGADTMGNVDCWTRMKNTDGYGGLNAIGCGIGCKICFDYPTEIITHAATSRLAAQPGFRFLLPGAQDARGMMHEQLADWPHLVQPMMRYYRAANHDNYTHECVDEDDVPCDTWPWMEHALGEPAVCDSGAGSVGIGGAVRGYFGEGTFYHGKWPQDGARIQCRRFPDDALRSVTVMSQGANTIFLTSATQGDGCGADWLIPGAGYVTASNCDSGFEHVHTGSTPELPSPRGTTYASNSGATPPCQHLFDHVAVVSNDATFANREGLDSHDVDLHNEILLKALERGLFEHVEFDRLDHEATRTKNSGLGRFSRSWDGTGLDITDPRLPVVRSYPARFSHTKWFGVPVTAQLVIVKVWMILDLALPHTKITMPTDVGPFGRNDFIEPHCVARINVWLGLRVAVDENEHGVQAVYTDGQSGIWPDITPKGNELLLRQKTPNQWQWPPAFVEWRGALNDFSQPSLGDQGYPNQVGDEDFNIKGPYGRSLKEACTALETWRVPGAAVQLDRNPENPNQHWTGGIYFTFKNSDDYRMCEA